MAAGGDYADYQYLHDVVEQRVIDEECLDDGISYTPKVSWRMGMVLAFISRNVDGTGLKKAELTCDSSLTFVRSVFRPLSFTFFSAPSFNFYSLPLSPSLSLSLSPSPFLSQMSMVIWIVSPNALTLDKYHQIERINL